MGDLGGLEILLEQSDHSLEAHRLGKPLYLAFAMFRLLADWSGSFC